MADPFEKSKTVDPEVRAYVYSLVNAVGGSSSLDGRYEVGDDAVHALKDLTRWLRLYDEKTGRYDVKRCIAEANLVKGDLVEVLAQWEEKDQESKAKQRLALGCLELLVPLTWPLEFDDERTTVNNHRHMPYLQLAQAGYKRAILHHDWAQILRTTVRVALPSLAQPRRGRSRRDDGIIRLLLHFFLNIAVIAQPQHLPSQGDENEISRSATIDAFHKQDTFSLFLTIGSSCGDEFVEQDVILLETLFHLVKGIEPHKLFMRKEQISKADNDELKTLLSKEKAMLGGYARNAPSRHNRFGSMIWVQRDNGKMSTVSGQHGIQNERSALQQMDASKKWSRPRYRGRAAQKLQDMDEFGVKVELTDSARRNLREFVQDFLDSSFNPLFSSVRKAIAGEADRLQRRESRNHESMFFYLIAWFLSAERARREAERAEQKQRQPNDNSFAYVAAVLDQETFILLNRCMQRASDENDFQALQSTLQAFTQILLTVQTMSESEDEEDQEIAENILNRIFYEESTHDRIVHVLKGAEKLGLHYLDAVTECVHVFVRMLERYSKQNVDLQVRSKRRSRRKAKKQQQQDSGENAEEDDGNEKNMAMAEDDTREAELTVRERKFDFARFSNKFMSQPCIDTWISYLNFFPDLSSQQLKRAHRYFYRVAFKNELFVYLFRVDILLLFHRMIKGPQGLDAEIEGFQEWEQLVRQIFRKCIKWLERRNSGSTWKEIAVIEMLFSKIPSSIFYLQNGYEKVVERSAPRPPAELEVKPSIEGMQAKVSVAVGVCIEANKADQLGWVKKELRRIVDERESWEQEAEARRGQAQEHQEEHQEALDGIDGESLGRQSAPAAILSPDNHERHLALFKDKHLRLLLDTLGFQRLGLPDDLDASWIAPGELTADHLRQALAAIQQAEVDPPTFEDGKIASDMVRSKTAAQRASSRRTLGPDDGGLNMIVSDDEGDSQIDDAMFPPNLREKRRRPATSDDDNDDEEPKKRRRLKNRAELTDAEREARAAERRKKEKEKNAKIKSSLYVTALDDESDDEADAEFFRLEAERRKNMAGLIRGQLVKEIEDASKKGKRGETVDGERMKNVARGLGIDRDEDESDVVETIRAPRRKKLPFTESDSEASEPEDDDEADPERGTPSTSPALDPQEQPRPLKEVSANVDKSSVNDGDVDDDSEDDLPITKAPPATARRNVRAGFIVDDDSDEK
ncbi:timeless-domain-containing protein [Polychaeton citri CBS 116435]|uniref:Topoisomerase 1-associated factor 1 n=1 Tax=Polychaeton citri CBS 116435 TaxID=1314669 RepID=A0A9P4UKL6_9PEZI|nr:timeless-domain-containing protein [Polychaeton citri CBS 116435]